MNVLTKLVVGLNEGCRRVSKGQTMTEYALIMSLIALAVYAAYNTLGTDITSLVDSVGGSL